MRHRTSLLILHWTTLLLIIAAVALVLTRKSVEDADLRIELIDFHRVIGLSILALTLLRLAARALLEPRFTPIRLSWPLRFASGASHLMLYAALITLPLLGWAQSSAKAHHFKLFGSRMPALIGYDPDRAELFAQWHEQLAWALLALIGLHAAAALYHHYVRRDEILRMMLGNSAIE